MKGLRLPNTLLDDEATRRNFEEVTRWSRDVTIALPEQVSALPAASAGLRGRTYLLLGGAGVADSVHLCMKTDTDTYDFKTVTVS